MPRVFATFSPYNFFFFKIYLIGKQSYREGGLRQSEPGSEKKNLPKS